MTSVAEAAAATSFTLITLGELTLNDRSGAAIGCPDKSLLLLAFLATQPDGARNRRDIANFLWPNAQDDAADTNLRSSLRRMRLAVGDAPILLSEGPILRRNTDALRCDLDTLSETERPVARLKWLTGAVSRGFLDRDRRHEHTVEHWLQGVRTTHLVLLRATFFQCLALHREAAGEEALQAAAVPLLVNDPTDEDVRHALQTLSAAAPPSFASHSSSSHSFASYPSAPMADRSPSSAVAPGLPQAAPRPPVEEAPGRVPFPYTGVSGTPSSVAANWAGMAPPSLGAPAFATAVQPLAGGALAGEVSRPALPRLALLPPDAHKDARHHGPLANALIEDITIGLCSMRSVSVVAPFTAERYRASNDKAALLERHSVTYALDTRRSQDGIYAQLIFLPADEILWAARFSVDQDSLATQRVEIARAILHSIADQVESSSAGHLDYQRKPEAYVSYLRGTQHLSSLELQDIRKARKIMRETLRLDKGFAPAMAGLARALTTEWLLTARGDQELLITAEQQAMNAVRQDPTLASGYRELGVVELYRGRLDESLEALATAEAISPHYADVLYSHADTLVHGARPREALEKITRAIDLNPLCPDSYLWSAAGACYFLGEYEAALAYIKRMDNARPADRLAAASWGMLGNARQARVYRQRVLQEHPDFELERWLELIPVRETWQRELYREGLRKAGFWHGD